MRLHTFDPNDGSSEGLRRALDEPSCPFKEQLLATCERVLRADPNWEQSVLALANVEKHNLCPEPFAEWAKQFEVLTTNPHRVLRAAELFVGISDVEAAIFLPCREGDPMVYMPKPRLPQSEPDLRPYAFASVSMEVKVKAWCAPTLEIGLELIAAAMAERAAARQAKAERAAAARQAKARQKETISAAIQGAAPADIACPADNEVLCAAKHALTEADRLLAATNAAAAVADDTLAAARNAVGTAKDTLGTAKATLATADTSLAAAKRAIAKADETMIVAAAARSQANWAVATVTSTRAEADATLLALRGMGKFGLYGALLGLGITSITFAKVPQAEPFALSAGLATFLLCVADLVIRKRTSGSRDLAAIIGTAMQRVGQM